jgi:hypothetical protein
VKKMAFVIVFWTTYIPFVILVLSLAGRHAMRALRGPRFERLLGGDGASNAFYEVTGIRVRELPIALDRSLAS